MRITSILAVALCLATLSGCRSPYVTTTVSNRTPTSVTLVEVDYPSASFGTQTLNPSADFHYRFKVLGSGAMKLTYTDSAQKEHTFNGPFLKEGAEGPVTIVITPDGVRWQTALGSPPPTQ